jgi:hypothetical protein
MRESRHPRRARRTTRRAFTIPTLCALALAAGSAAHAANGIYIGAGVSRANVNDAFGQDLHLDIHSTEPELIAGVRLMDLFGVELNYMDLGSEDRSLASGFGTAHADAKQFSAFAVGYLPLPLLDLYGKAGLMRWQLSGNAQAAGTPLFAVNDNGTEFAYGVGAQLKLGPFAPRLEWEHAPIPHTDGLHLWTLGVTFTFF